MSATRRQERRFAFQVIYALNFEHNQSKGALTASFDNFWTEEETKTKREHSYAWVLVQGVFTQLKALDDDIAKHSKHWKLGRIAKVELTILRLALFEMLYCRDVPTRVAINEAVELAKNFGDENSKTFINGVLDAVARTCPPQS